MKTILYLLLSLPFWSVAGAIQDEVGFATGYSLEQGGDVYFQWQLDDVQADILNEYKLVRRRRMSSGPVHQVPYPFDYRIPWFFNQHLHFAVFYEAPTALLSDATHCHRMTPF